MKHIFATTLVAAGLTLSAGLASAATLGLTTEAPGLSASTASIDFFDFDPDGDLSTAGAVVDATDGISFVGTAEIGFGIGYLLSDPTDGLTGGFDVLEDGAEFLAGDLIAVGFTENVIELQFGNLSGTGAADFGTSVLALISFATPLGADPFSALNEGDSLTASINISNVVDAAPIPLPAGLPLLLTGLLGFGLLRRRA